MTVRELRDLSLRNGRWHDNRLPGVGYEQHETDRGLVWTIETNGVRFPGDEFAYASLADAVDAARGVRPLRGIGKRDLVLGHSVAVPR